MASTKAPRPSQMFVEVSPEPPEPRLRGALRGLNPNLNILRSNVEHTVEDVGDGGDENVTSTTSKHATRASRGNGKVVSYDMKYHPMDVVTRPNSAAVRKKSGSLSLACSDDDEDDEQLSDVSSQSSSQASNDSSAESSQDENEARATKPRVVLGPRTPDPRASRHSSRKAARKAVIYSSKHHPQDFGLPGYRSKAVVVLDDSEPELPQPESEKRKADSPDVGDQSDGETTVVKDKPCRPHKKLKSLSDARPGRSKKKRGRPAKAKMQKAKPSSGDGKAAAYFIEADTREPQPASAIHLSSDDDSNKEMEDEDAAEDGHADDNSHDLLFNACTQASNASNLLDTDESGGVMDGFSAELDQPSTATVDTTTTPHLGTATPATTCRDEVDETFHLPTYVKDGLSPRSTGSASAVIRKLFGGLEQGSLSDVTIVRPYLHYPPQSSKHSQQPTMADSEDDRSKLSQQSTVADSEDDSSKPSQQSTVADSEDDEETSGGLRQV